MLWFLAVALTFAQGPAGERAPMAEEVFKNVQILKGTPVDQFMGTMGFFSASLGLNCTDCHTDKSGGDWARYADENPRKQTARRMMQMVSSVNQMYFGGRQVVTCNTCHRGTTRPNVMPSLDLLYSSPPPEEPGDPIQQASGQPAADQILDKYLRAVGGPERVAAFTSFTGKGNYSAYDDAEKSPFEMYARGPGQRTITAHPPSGDTTWTLNGNSAWVAAPATDKPVPVLAITGPELDGVKLESEVFFPARIKQSLTNDRRIAVREANTIRTASSVGDSWRSYENVAHYCRRAGNGSAARRSSRCRDLRYRERAHVEGNGDGVDLGQSSLFPEI